MDEQDNDDTAAWDDANVLHLQAQTIAVLADAGFSLRDAVDAVVAGDLDLLRT